MPSYLYQISYSSEAWAAMIKHPQDRVAAVSKVVEKLGEAMKKAGSSGYKPVTK